jgi:hypothetical protein
VVEALTWTTQRGLIKRDDWTKAVAGGSEEVVGEVQCKITAEGRISTTRPCLVESLQRELLEIFMHSLGSGLNVLHNDPGQLSGVGSRWRAGSNFWRQITSPPPSLG